MGMTGKQNLVVTIDGPSGVGKSTISRKVAERLGYTYLDTGAMYRAVAYHFQVSQIDIADLNQVKTELDNIVIELFPAGDAGDAQVRLNGQDIGNHIRTPEISMLASSVSALPVVREKLTMMQQNLGDQGRVVAEGRDTGTVVFPDAAFKFYLDASPEERAQRRVRQLRQRGEAVDEDALLEMIIKRDKNDSERELAPLKMADDAVYVDTTFITADQVLETMLRVIREKKAS